MMGHVVGVEQPTSKKTNKWRLRLNYLEGEAEIFISIKVTKKKRELEQIFNLLIRRLGVGAHRNQSGNLFASSNRNQNSQ